MSVRDEKEQAQVEGETLDESENQRRRFLKTALKFGVYTAPVVTILFDPARHAKAQKFNLMET